MGKKKIEIKRKEKETDRLIAFSKRRKGLFKKAHELHSLSAAHVALVVFSPGGKIFIYGDPCFNQTVHNFLYDAATNPVVTHPPNTYASSSDHHRYMSHDIEACKSWLDALDVDGCDDVDRLVALKNDLDQFRHMLIQKQQLVHIAGVF